MSVENGYIDAHGIKQGKECRYPVPMLGTIKDDRAICKRCDGDEEHSSYLTRTEDVWTHIPRDEVTFQVYSYSAAAYAFGPHGPVETSRFHWDDSAGK